MISRVLYRVGEYAGVVLVSGVDPDEETATVVARAKKILARRSGGSLPPGSESWIEDSREEPREEGSC